MYDINKILSLIPHRYPFVFVDRVLSVDPGKSIHGIKNISYCEPYFQGHIPKKPVFPGVYMIEALAQLAGVLLMLDDDNQDRMFYLAKVDKTRYRKLLVPGDQLQLHADFMRSRGDLFQFSARIMLEESVAMETEVWLAKGTISG